MAKAKKLKKTKKKLAVSKKKVKKAPAKRKVKKASAKRAVKKVQAVPKGYHSITPYLIVNQGMKAIEFYKKAFNAKLAFCMEHANGKVGHAELKIGDSKIMLGDECPEFAAFSPEHFKGSPVSIHFYTKNVDAVVKQALEAGAKLVKPVENMFYGDRSGGVVDPYGHHWYISTHIEDVSLAKVKKRAAELFKEKY